ncbi:MAG: hypothetical protein D6767_05580, partial [Candidatus Hydrogenedentota bacterium]
MSMHKRKHIAIILSFLFTVALYADTRFQDDFEAYTLGQPLTVGAGATPGPLGNGTGTQPDWLTVAWNANGIRDVVANGYTGQGVHHQQLNESSSNNRLQADFTGSGLQFTYIDIYFKVSDPDADSFNLYFRDAAGNVIIATDLGGEGYANGNGIGRLQTWVGQNFVMPAACDIINNTDWRRVRVIGDNTNDLYKIIMDNNSNPGVLDTTNCSSGWLTPANPGPVSQIQFNDYSWDGGWGLGDTAYYIMDRVKVYEGAQDPSTDTTPPTITSIGTIDGNSNGLIEAIKITFSEAVDDASVQNAVNNGRFDIKLGGAAVTGLTFNPTYLGDVADDNVVYLLFTENNAYKTDAIPTFNYIDNNTPGVTDIVGNALAATTFTVTDTAPPAMLSAFASDNTTILNGPDGDDTVVITFSESTNAPVINSSNINTVLAPSNAHSWLDGAGAITSAVWSSTTVANDTLTITMGSDAVQATIQTDPTPDSITADGTTIQDAAGNATNNTITLSGTFNADSTPPTITSWETQDLNKNGQIDAIKITFSENIKDSSVRATDFAVTGYTGLTFNSSANGDVADNNVIYISFTESGAPDTNATPAVSYTQGTLTDLAGNLLATTSTAAATDKAPPALISAVATDPAPSSPGINAGDYVTLTFSENTNQPSITASIIDGVLQLNNAHTWKDSANAISSATWTSATTLVVTLNAASGTPAKPSVAVGDIITLDGVTILDAVSNAANNSAPITGSFGDLAIQTLETQDLNKNGQIDAIKITFNDNVDDTTVNPADFSITGYTGLAFSSTTNGDTANNNVIYITFTESGTADTDATPAVTYTAGTLTNLAGTSSLASAGPLTPTDKAAPQIISAVAADGGASPGPNAGDTVTITFSEPTTKPAVSAANIDLGLTLNNSHTWLDGSSNIGSAVWNAAGDVLTVTLSSTTSAPTIAVGDTITTSAGSLQFQDGVGNISVNTFSAITGTFGVDTIPPTITAVETADLNGNGKIDAVKVTFDENISDASVTATDFDVVGYTGESFSSTTNGDVTNNNIIYITFTEGASADTGSTPTVNYTQGTLTDMWGNLLASTSKTATDKAAPVLLSRETQDFNANGQIDAIKLTYSENISDATVNATNFSVAGYTGLTFNATGHGDAANDNIVYFDFT